MRKIFYGWRIVFVFFFIYFYVSGTIYSFTAFFEPISIEFGWSFTKISIAASIRGLEVGLFAPIVGILCDRFGTRRLLFYGVFTMGLGLILFSLTSSLTTFYCASVVFSLGLSTCNDPVIVPAVANWFRKDMGKALGIIYAGFGAGGLLVPLTVVLINFYQWRTAFIIFGFGIWLFGIPLIFIIRKSQEKFGYLQNGTRSSTQEALTTEQQDRKISVKDAIKTRTFWHISLADAIRLMTTLAVITHILPYLSSMGISRARAAFVATSIPVLSIIGRFVFGWLGDIFSKNHIMAIIYFLTGLSILALAYVQVTWLIIPFLILFPLSWGASTLRGAIMREYFGRTSLGSILGIMAGIATIARMLGPSITGWTYDTFGSYHLIWLFFASTFVISTVLMLTVKPLRNEVE